MKIISSIIELETGAGISLHNLMRDLRGVISSSDIKNGFVTITSQHTSTAIIINEDEPRLHEDIKRFLPRLIPPKDGYLHNDIALRDCPSNEPENTHSHLMATTLDKIDLSRVSVRGLSKMIGYILR